MAKFVVSDDLCVTYEYDDKTYGPYIAKEDSTAIPNDLNMSGRATGIELSYGDKILFRGAVVKNDHSYFYYNDDGSLHTGGIYSIDNYGIKRDENGNVVDANEPSVSTILELINNPKLIHKGGWSIWALAIFVCIVNTFSILYADELFALRHSFRIRHTSKLEPSNFEITSRYISWIFLTIGALVLFIMGL